MSRLGEEDIRFRIKVEGIEEAAQTMDNSLPIMLMTVRSMNAARLAIVQTARGIRNLNITNLMYGFLNMIQVVRNLTSLMRILQKSTASAGAAQAILATLTGKWWYIPLALAAGAAMYSVISSLATGGPINQSGLYMLHKGEYVVPANMVNRYGPIFVNVNRVAGDDADYRAMVRGMGTTFALASRRGG